VHFVGGWTGTLLIGFFSTDGINTLANKGILYGGGGKYGGWNLLWHQAAAAAAVTVFSFTGTFVLAKVIGLVMRQRVTEEEEIAGLDLAIHGESAYDFGPLAGSGGHYVPSAAQRQGTVQRESVQA
jgi:Amt family ammonium transporter